MFETPRTRETRGCLILSALVSIRTVELARAAETQLVRSCRLGQEQGTATIDPSESPAVDHMNAKMSLLLSRQQHVRRLLMRKNPR